MKRTILTILITLLVVINIMPSTFIGYDRLPFQVIAWDTGIVLDLEGDGVVTSPCVDSYYNYIKYDEDIEPGTTAFTIFIFNPFNRYNDDIVYRFDFYKGV